MKTRTWVLINIFGIALGLITVSGIVISSDDDTHEKRWGDNIFKQSRLDVAPVKNTFYNDECGACHFPYQPGLLPARSWQRLMGGLEAHFGENAELELPDAQQLTDYLVKYAADTSSYKRSRGISRSINKNDIPLRISETRYFRRKHHELSTKMVKGNPKVRSFSNCELCHTQAAEGFYNEHQVTIPGYSQWDD
ncbi:MAG: diheme cytochrome c [Ectothiorhodospiraceae bacterium]|nr:diheme cytochrome c [Ectothiorhodospiraceae bacterium]